MKYTQLRDLIRALFICLFLLSLQAKAQVNSKKLDNWLSTNTSEMGGRSVLMVYRDGKIVYSNAVNKMSLVQKATVRYVARVQGKTPDLGDFTPSAKIPIASCSKWLSAALVMTFVDEGKLRLNDTLGKFLPIMSQHGKGNISIAQCLAHLTAIKAPTLKESLSEMKNLNSMDETITNIAQLPMEGQPGKVFHYSNVGLQLVGAVIEKIGGKDFESLFAERIATPLEMGDTDFGKGKVASPAGGAYSTANDYMNFLVMILNKGIYKGKRILSEKSIGEMQVNRITTDVKVTYSPTEAGGLGYGYGEWLLEDGVVSSPGLFGSFPVVSNQHHYAAVLITFYLNNKGRQERYAELRKLIEQSGK